MNEKLWNSIISAIVGGVVGAMVVFFASERTKFDSLEVGKLIITHQASLVNHQGKDEVVIKDGSVLANNTVLGTKFIGTQYQGHVFVGNRIFTSPDNLVGTPMDQWRFYTEIGSSETLGGELIVRSPKGANVVDQPINDGAFLRAGFDSKDLPQVFVRQNDPSQTTFTVQLFRLNSTHQPEASAKAADPSVASGKGDETIR